LLLFSDITKSQRIAVCYVSGGFVFLNLRSFITVVPSRLACLQNQHPHNGDDRRGLQGAKALSPSLLPAFSFLFADAVKVNALADGAMLGPSCPHRFLPFMLAVLAIKNPHSIHQLVIAAFDIDGFAVNQGIGHRLPRALDDSAECGPGNSHVPAGLLVGHSQQIGQSDGLTLINGKANFLQIKHGNASRLEIAYFRTKRDSPFFLWPDHIKFLYENILKN
jgi:hypothetical protein